MGAADSGLVKIAYHNAVMVGGICCRHEVDEAGAEKVYIMTIAVLAPYQGNGFGSKLVVEVLNNVKQNFKNVKEVYLHVQTTNEEAIAFYKRFGFEVGETIQNY